MEAIGTRNNDKVIEYEDNSMYDTENNLWIKSSLGLDDDHYVYVISDINGSIYIGETCLPLPMRMRLHKSEKGNCAAKELDLDKCEIELLEICKKRDKEETEFNWINHYPDCVNYNKKMPLSFELRQNKRTYQHFYYINHGQEFKEKQNLKRQTLSSYKFKN